MVNTGSDSEIESPSDEANSSPAEILPPPPARDENLSLPTPSEEADDTSSVTLSSTAGGSDDSDESPGGTPENPVDEQEEPAAQAEPVAQKVADLTPSHYALALLLSCYAYLNQDLPEGIGLVAKPTANRKTGWSAEMRTLMESITKPMSTEGSEPIKFTTLKCFCDTAIEAIEVRAKSWKLPWKGKGRVHTFLDGLSKELASHEPDGLVNTDSAGTTKNSTVPVDKAYRELGFFAPLASGAFGLENAEDELGKFKPALSSSENAE